MPGYAHTSRSAATTTTLVEADPKRGFNTVTVAGVGSMVTVYNGAIKAKDIEITNRSGNQATVTFQDAGTVILRATIGATSSIMLSFLKGLICYTNFRAYSDQVPVDVTVTGE